GQPGVSPASPFQPYVCICAQEHLEAAQHCAVAAFEAAGRTVLPMEFASEAPGDELGFSTASHQRLQEQQQKRLGKKTSVCPINLHKNQYSKQPWPRGIARKPGLSVCGSAGPANRLLCQPCSPLLTTDTTTEGFAGHSPADTSQCLLL
uniref:Uncharacterized protein n=1 Tax=Catharus ustulatus TaxID=91951 RepID=A0A8C3YA31_CATUS